LTLIVWSCYRIIYYHHHHHHHSHHEGGVVGSWISFSDTFFHPFYKICLIFHPQIYKHTYLHLAGFIQKMIKLIQYRKFATNSFWIIIWRKTNTEQTGKRFWSMNRMAEWMTSDRVICVWLQSTDDRTTERFSASFFFFIGENVGTWRWICRE
jgi:hypothetical protein